MNTQQLREARENILRSVEDLDHESRDEILDKLEALDAEYRASQREPNYAAINLHDSAYRMWLEAGSNRRLIKGAIDTMIDGLTKYAETLKGDES